MKRKYVMLLLLLIGTSFKFYAQEQLTNYLKIAAENNSGLKAKFNAYMASVQKIAQVGSLPDPMVAFGYFIEPVETKLGPQQAKISISQMFPWFGTLGAKKNTAEYFAKAKYEQFEGAKSKLYYEVKSTYYNLYFTNKAIVINKENLNILNSFKGLAQVKAESGKGTLVDMYEVQMELNDLQNQLASLEDAYDVLSVRFKKLLNVSDTLIIIVDDSLSGAGLSIKENELDSIFAGNNALGVLRRESDALAQQERVAKKVGLPNIKIGMDYIFIGDNNSGSADAGKDAIVFPKIGVSVPIYRKKYKAKFQEVVYKQQANENMREDKLNTLTVLFNEVWKDYNDAERRLGLYKEQEDLANKSLSILKSEYSTGAVRFEELLRIERRLLKYALEYRKAQTDKEAAVAFVRYLQGR